MLDRLPRGLVGRKPFPPDEEERLAAGIGADAENPSDLKLFLLIHPLHQ